MTKEEVENIISEYIKDNLDIDIDVDSSFGIDGDKCESIVFTVRLNKEEICRSTCSI